jgi:hypothetical protein
MIFIRTAFHNVSRDFGQTFPFPIASFSSKVMQNLNPSKEKGTPAPSRILQHRTPSKDTDTSNGTEKGKGIANDEENKGNTFDYIVIGGGTAGLTIATRLAEDSKVTVAVIEAGKKWHPFSSIVESVPSADVPFVGTEEKFPAIDWGFRTEPDPASGDKSRSYARGKCLGGR